MPVELIGTRASELATLHDLVERLDDRADSLAIASAYWDAHACTTAIDLARHIDGRVRLVLWTAGATRAAWIAAREASVDPALELRFIDSPAGTGIFHAKAAGVVSGDGTWSGAVVGSANLTAAGLARNVELGVLMHREPVALAQLRAWFDELWDAAVPAAEIDWDAAIAIAPAKSEAAERKRIFAAASLAAPAPAPPFTS